MDQQQLELLWEYQSEDMKADKIKKEIKNSPTRQKLEKNREIILENQKKYKQIDEQSAQRADRLPIIRAGIARCEAKIAELEKSVEENPPETLEETTAKLKQVEECRASLAGYDREIADMSKKASASESRRRELVRRNIQLKKEFDDLRVVYESESKQKKAELEAQQKAAAEKKKGIDPAVIAEYEAIKKHVVPPLARLVSGRCGGCNTSLPSAVLGKIKAGNEMVHCESCDRVLIM